MLGHCLKINLIRKLPLSSAFSSQSKLQPFRNFSLLSQAAKKRASFAISPSSFLRISLSNNSRFYCSSEKPPKIPKGWENFQDNPKFKSNEHNKNEDKDESFIPPNPDKRQQMILQIMILACLMIFHSRDTAEGISWTDFRNKMLAPNIVTRIVAYPNSGRAYIYLKHMSEVNGKTANEGISEYYITFDRIKNFEEKLEETQRELGRKTENFVNLKFRNSDGIMSEIAAYIPILILLGGAIYLMSKRYPGIGSSGGMSSPFDMIKSKNIKPVEPKNLKIRFDDVAGMEEAKGEVVEFVDFLKNPTKYTDLGAHVPKGALLVGPPGTGKTLLAKAVAGEAGVPFIAMAGSDFVEMFVGVGPSRVRELFQEAKKCAPSIIYIDEIDAIGKKRGGGANTNTEQENTLNQLLVEMDGFLSQSNVLVLASTNRSDILDQALLRPGRFDRNIEVTLPDVKERKAISLIHMAKLKFGDAIHREELAQRCAELTPGFSGADLANMCNEAALYAARWKKESITRDHFDHAIDRVYGGVEKHSQIVSTEEREQVAYHEAGHALVAWFLQYTSPALKVSIIPRSKSVTGYTQYSPDNHKLYSKEQILDKMSMLLGGRIAEKIIFNRMSTIAEDDLRRVTDLAYKTITLWGMNKKVGRLSFQPDAYGKRTYSEKLSADIDEEVRKSVELSVEKATEIISTHKNKLQEMAALLLKNEVLHYEEIEEILGKRPHVDETHIFRI